MQNSKLLKNSQKALLILSVFFLFLPIQTYSAVRSSENYKIFADNLSSGGEYSTSTNYRVWDSVGDIVSDENSTSTNYIATLGFQAQKPDDSLTTTLSKTSINLGTISASGVSKETITITYVTNANGFTSTISEDKNLSLSDGSADIDDVADGAVTAGNEEYGVKTSGSMGQQNSADTAITTTAKTIATRSDPTTSASISLIFSASVSNSTPDGTYGHAITITTSGNF